MQKTGSLKERRCAVVRIVSDATTVSALHDPFRADAYGQMPPDDGYYLLIWSVHLDIITPGAAHHSSTVSEASRRAEASWCYCGPLPTRTMAQLLRTSALAMGIAASAVNGDVTLRRKVAAETTAWQGANPSAVEPAHAMQRMRA